jgi:hypothetical protein
MAMVTIVLFYQKVDSRGFVNNPFRWGVQDEEVYDKTKEQRKFRISLSITFA